MPEITPQHPGSTVSLATAKTRPAVLQQSFLIELLSQLAATIEVEQVISTFMECISSHLKFDNYSYDHQVLEIGLDHGKHQRHLASYKLTLGSENLGNLKLTRASRFRETELVLFESLLANLVHTLKNALDFRTAKINAYRDALTGINNRTSFEESLEREINLANRYKVPFSILVIDIDHFKSVNDRFGHRCGDEVLVSTAQSMRAIARNSDLLFRYGGEEFVMVLSNVDCDQAKDAAERLRAAVEQVIHDCKGERITVSVSVGLACLREGDDGMTLFDRADAALYQAKDNGRNQVHAA